MSGGVERGDLGHALVAVLCVLSVCGTCLAVSACRGRGSRTCVRLQVSCVVFHYVSKCVR